jgi:hypothetical protein
MGKKITKSDVENALDSFEETHAKLSKASEDDLDQPEGADLGNPEKKKMSDAAKGKKPNPFMKKEEEHEEEEEHEDEEHEEKSMDGEDEEKSKKSYKMKSKKAMDADHVDEDESHGDHHKAMKMKAMKMKAMEMKAKKSFSEDMPEEIQTKIDVSEFLKSLVDHTGTCIDELATEVSKSERRIAGRYNELTSAVEDVQKSQAKIGIVLKAICQRIGIIENAPAQTRKSESVAKSGGVDRKFSSGLEGDAEAAPVFKSLSKNPAVAKSQISEVLCDMVRKGEAQDLDVIGFETNGYIRPDLMPKLTTALN